MSTLRYFDFYKSYELINLMFYDFNKSGNYILKEDVVVYQKFIELSDKIAMANQCIKNVENTDQISSQYFNLCNAITAYNDCYDYFRQVIYWGFGFYTDFNTSEQYLKELKNCIDSKHEPDELTGKIVRVDSNFTSKARKYQEQCPEFKTFMKQYYKFQGFVSDNKIGIGSIANCIKHQGGFITLEMFNKHRFNNLLFTSENGDSYFDAKQIYAYILPTQEILNRLYSQNDKIVEISFWLFEHFFPTRKIAPYNSHALPKSKILLVNGTEQDK